MKQYNLFGQEVETTTASSSKSVRDPYEAITNKIIEAMKNGIIPWQKPWNGGSGLGYVSHTSGREYSYLNTILLAIDGKQPGEFLTFKQVKDAGGSVKKGSKSTTIYFYKQLHFEIDAVDENGNPELDEDGNVIKLQRNPICLKGYNVFHIDQCEGVTPKWQNAKPASKVQPIEAAQAIADGYYSRPGAPALHVQVSDRAFYRPYTDEVIVPKLEQYTEAAEYYSTLFHESVHSTGHESRLGRIKTNQVAAFGSDDYSREELVAEIGAAFLVNRAGIDSAKAFNNSVAYLQGWIKHLSQKKRDFAIAAAQAEKAAKYILGESK